MKQLVCRLFSAGAIAAAVSILSVGVAKAATTQSPEVVRGLTWLQSQVQPAGTLANELTSIATPLQNRAESLQTFKVLATVPTALADQLATDTQNNTEYLARRAVTLNVAGRDASAIITSLLARQNSDGGFSGAAGYNSNALDTTWVMLALAQNAQGSTTPAQKARSYLLGSIQADGGVGAGSDSSRINANALALLALQMFPQDLNTATALKQISSWLLLKQGADGSWLKNSNLTALTLAAVSPLVSDPTISTAATTYLKALQGVDGSWGSGDPFLTAVVLRALSQASATTANSGPSSIIGNIADKNTATALAGATVTLSGAATATATTAADGSFNFANLTAGSYTLQITKAGYSNYTNSFQLSASQTLNVGTISLAQSLNTGIVNGKVTDAATGLALSGVTVTLNGATTAVTDANGLYTFTGVTPGTVSLSASLTGYATASGTGTVLGGQTLVFSPALTAAGAVTPTTGVFSGKVVAAGSGTPLAGVAIQLNGTAVGVTAADGSFSLTLAPGSYTAAFTLAGYNPATATFLLTAGAALNVGTITLAAQLTTTTISGTVKDATTGNPINGAQIQLLNGSIAATGTNGAYALSGLTGTGFTLSVSATGYTTQSVQLVVPQPTNITQDFSLQVQAAVTSTVSGQVVDQTTATPLSGATATLSGASTASLTTGVDGKINFPNLVAGNYTLQITKAGYTTSTSTFQLNANQALSTGTIAMAQVLTTGIVNGKVTDAVTGLPLSGVTVTLNGATTAVTDANGFYTFTGVTPGTVSLSASFTGYATASGTGTVLGGQTVVFSPALIVAGAAAPPTTGVFTGKIVAAGSGTPLAGVSITLNGTASGVTAADGSFALTLPPGAYTAAFTLTGFNSATFTFMLTAGATANNGTVTLIPQLTTTTISGMIKDATSGNPINGAQVQVLNGSVVTTGANGAYSVSGLVGTSFNLRVSATGYVTQSVQIMVSQPANITQDFPLQVQSGLGVTLGPLLVNPGSAGSATDVSVGTLVSEAATGTPVTAVLTMQVINAQGTVVGGGAAYDKTGTNMLGVLSLSPGQQVPLIFRWNTGQFQPGTYTLIARVVELGSISQATPLGRVLTEARGTMTITSGQHFAGTVTANPPVVQANANTPVKLSAVLVNDGNAVLPAQAYQLQIINVATGAVIATRQANGTAFSPNGLQSLVFADWLPATGGGNFSLELQAVGSAGLGKVTGKVYVGDAATASFTVNKLAVPAGTQPVRGNIHVTGQDSVQGTLGNALAPMIKAAIQKAVTYNDASASSWTLTNQCLGCHVQTQALLGGETSNPLTTYNITQRNVIFNRLTTNQQSDGSIKDVRLEVRTPTMLGLWALTGYHNQNEIASTLVRSADFLINTQSADGSWYADYTYDGWWTSLVANTGFNVRSLASVRQTLAQAPAGTAARYSLTPWATGNSIAGACKSALSDAAGNVYISACDVGTVTLIKPDGTTQLVMSGLWGPYAMTLGADGSLYVATASSGVKRRAPNGTVTTLSPTGGTSIALAPDGSLYLASWWSNAIYQITPQGVTTTYLSGGALMYPRGIAVNAAGELLVANGDARILKYKADKTYDVVVDRTGRNPYCIIQDGTGWLVGTYTGLYRYNSDWQGQRLIFDQPVVTLGKLPNGQLIVGDNNFLYTLTNTLDVVGELAKMDTAIANGVNWLLAANVNANSNMDLAHQLIGLGGAYKVLAGTPMASSVQTKMASVGSLLRSHQLADGGWGRTVTNPSDSMVTAMVGVALDYLNPSMNDPVVQNALNLLLGRQQPDGSWISENGVMYTPLAATTWVSIWLPIALDRIGGINTDLSVSTPSNVTLSNPSLAPTSSAANAAGGMDYLWKLQGVTSSGQDIGFDLSLATMVLGENRPVASDAHLTFNNSFTGQPVSAPIAVPRVTASAFLGLGVTTDLTSYPANTSVNITAAVNNTSTTGPLDGSVKLEIYSADNTLVGVAGTVPFTGLAAGLQMPLNGTWNTGTVAAGSYYVLATLYDAQNAKVGTAQTAFGIAPSGAGMTPGATGVGTAISVNKQSYQPYDIVQIASRTSNLTLNQAQLGLTAVVTVYGPSGAVLWTTQPSVLQQLLPGGFIDSPSSLQLSSAPAGQYRVVVTIQNGAAVVAQAATTFTVLSTANTGNGLKGTIGALPKIVPQTDPVVLNWTASNLGNADFAALPIKLTIVDPVLQQVMTQQTFSVPLAQSKTYQTAFTWDTSPANVGSMYTAILAVTVGGRDIVLAQDNFLVTYPPVKLGVTQNSVRENRVLVWLACESEETHKADGQQSQDSQKSSDAQQTGQGSNSAASGNDHASRDNSAGNQDNAQPIAPPCIQTRTTFLQGLLGTLKVPYLITANQDDFTKAFREGRYNVYWLSGGIKLAEKDAAHKDSSQNDAGRNDLGRSDKSQRDAAHKDNARRESDNEGLLEEIREAIYRGDSLILDGAAQDTPLREAAGVTYSGQFSGKNLQLNTTGPLFTVQTLPTLGTAQKMTVTTATSQATFVVPATPDDHQSNDGQNHGQQSGDAQGHSQQANDGQSNSQQGNDHPSSAQPSSDHQADDAHRPAPLWPAIVSNDYGRGHSLDFGFDLVDTLQNSTAPASWSTLLQTGLTNLLPPLPATYSAGAYVGLNTSIQNQARAVDLAVATQLPAGSTLLSTLPKATLDANGQPSWLFNLPQAATQTLQLSMRLPSLSGTHKALTTIDSIRNGTSRRYGEYAFYWTVAASDTVGSKLVTDLRALALTKAEEIKARDRAVAKLQQAQGYIGQAKYTEAIDSLLKAVEKLRRITSVDISNYRLSLDGLLQETEWNWLRTGGATQTPATQHTETEAVNK